MQRTAPLGGLTVLELGHSVAAPYAGLILAELGARVIKVENPATGDYARGWGPPFLGDDATVFHALNRSKESFTLDVKHPKAAEILTRLVARADVFIQNLAPGAMARAGFGSADLRARHPRLITVDISGYGEEGEYAGMKAYDLLVQAESGLVAVTGAPGPWG